MYGEYFGYQRQGHTFISVITLTKLESVNTGQLVAEGLSILICCHNSALRLPETLRHIALQHFTSPIAFEVIVIDNCSSDDTVCVAREQWESFRRPDINFRVISVPEPGKSKALHAGVSASVYHYILICDDDNWLRGDYVEKAFNILHSNPLIGAAGGRGIAVSDVDLPPWFSGSQHGFAVGGQGDRTGDITSKKFLWGAGMIFQRSLYIKAYADLPSFLTGPNGDSVSRGEDVEFCMRIILLGYQLYYDEDLVFHHYMPRNRLTEEYRYKLFEGFPNERHILDIYSRLIDIYRSGRYKKAVILLKSLLRFLISKTSFSQKWSYRYEAETIYLLTGLRLSNIPKEVWSIKKLSLTKKKI